MKRAKIEMIVLLSLYLLLQLTNSSASQTPTNYETVDIVTLQIPDSFTHTTQDIADYIKLKFEKDDEKARAGFVWLINNLEYDISVDFPNNKEERIQNAIALKRGVCLHYAEVLVDIYSKCGLKSHLVTGYVKQEGIVRDSAHAWCVSMIDSSWYLFDPTWGAGYLDKKKFMKKINFSFFKSKSENFIKSHMPFDPMWQLSYYPISNKEFSNKNSDPNTMTATFNFPDSIDRFEGLSRSDQLLSSGKRMSSNGINNRLIKEELQHVLYSYAIEEYNQGINQFNDYLSYRNRNFTPRRTDAELKALIDLLENSIRNAEIVLHDMEPSASINRILIDDFKKSIKDLQISLHEQRLFVEKYLRTKKPFRSLLFYRHVLWGTPVN